MCASSELTVDWILDTHPHADHFSAAVYLKEDRRADRDRRAHRRRAEALGGIYNLPDFPADGSQWDRLFADGDIFSDRRDRCRVMYSPGHTLASITYVVGDAAFVHDTLFSPTADARAAIFRAAARRSCGDRSRKSWPCPERGCSPGMITSLAGASRAGKHGRRAEGDEHPFQKSRRRGEFVALREARDRTLPMPRLILHALQVNIRGGRLPNLKATGAAI